MRLTKNDLIRLRYALYLAIRDREMLNDASIQKNTDAQIEEFKTLSAKIEAEIKRR
jgi:hypothetical protein